MYASVELGWNILEIKATRTLSDTAWSEPCTGSVGSTSIEWSTCRYISFMLNHWVIDSMWLPKKAMSYFSESLERQG